MKKNYFKIASASVLLFIMVACGLEFTEIKFSSHAIQPGGKLTIDIDLKRANGVNLDWPLEAFSKYYYLGVRVPQDWTNAELLAASDTKWMDGTTEFDTEDSEFYAAFLELCYPKDGYKWVAFQSKNAFQISGEPTNVTLELTAGSLEGDFRLDFMGGCSNSSPSELYKNGTIDYQLAFNNWGQIGGLVPTGNLKEIDGKYYVSCQENLFMASTLTQAEIDARAKSLDYIQLKCPADGKMYPVTTIDVVNYEEKNNPLKEAYLKDDENDKLGPKDQVIITHFDLNVNVSKNNSSIDEVYESSVIDVKAVKGGIEVTSNGGTATVYDLAGRILATEFVNGVATIDVRPGACIVRVIEGTRSTVSKVIVK